ncbi:MAG: hypothetical protein ACI9OU_000314 [Candidatus Promineifilaceae bacterium]|jgi:hypothetical protein
MVSAWRTGYFFLHGNSVVNLVCGLWDGTGLFSCACTLNATARLAIRKRNVLWLNCFSAFVAGLDFIGFRPYCKTDMHAAVCILMDGESCWIFDAYETIWTESVPGWP